MPGSYELLNCFVTVRPDLVAAATFSLSSLSFVYGAEFLEIVSGIATT